MTSQTGYPSIDKPWLKFYSEEAKNSEKPYCTIYEYLYENNKNNLSNYALNYFNHKITYRELFENIDLIANALHNYGVKSGDVVSIITVSSVASVLLFYALNKIGAVSNFINVMSNQKDMVEYLNDADSELVVTLDLFANNVVAAAKQSKVNRVIVYSLEEWMPKRTAHMYRFKTRNIDKSYLKENIVLTWNEFIKSSVQNTQINYSKNPKSVCFYGHTGGTTGFPKTVLLNDNSFNSVAWQYIQSFPHQKGEVFLSVIVPFVVYGSMINIHMPLCLGLEVAVIPKFDSNMWHKYYKTYHPNHICAIPAYISAMCDDKKFSKMNLSKIKTVGMGGEGMNVSLEEKINTFLNSRDSKAKVMKGYGMTEVCATAASEMINAQKTGSVGIPFIHNNVMIYDNEKNRELTYGETGEICLQCESMMIDYKDNQEETNKLVKIHSDGSKWIHTGDLGYIDEDGFLFVEGRMKRMILTLNNGLAYKTFPAQTEEVLNKHPSIRESCVVSMHKDKKIVLKAVIVLEDAKEVDHHNLISELNTLCNETLSSFQIPEKYVFVDYLPRTDAGKVDYRKLEE